MLDEIPHYLLISTVAGISESSTPILGGRDGGEDSNHRYNTTTERH